MTDIYIKKNRSSKKPVIAALVILAGIAMLIVWVQRSKDGPGKQETVVPEKEQEQPDKRPKEKAPRNETAFKDPGLKLVAKAKNLRDQEQLPEARKTCFHILETSTNRTALAEAEQLLGQIHIRQVFTPSSMDEKVDYTIQQGDSLAVLAKKFKTNIELIRKGNNVTGSLIRTGDRFRILQGDFSITVDKSDNDLVLYLNNRYFKRYRVGTGKYERTPEGAFKITERMAQPTWWRPDGKAIPFGHEDNVLGTHWLSLDIPGYGIHGTWEPETIGKQESQGCIRLENKDIEELYTLVPRGTQVVIKE